jgi:hypothetical protein
MVRWVMAPRKHGMMEDDCRRRVLTPLASLAFRTYTLRFAARSLCPTGSQGTRVLPPLLCLHLMINQSAPPPTGLSPLLASTLSLSSVHAGYCWEDSMCEAQASQQSSVVRLCWIPDIRQYV